jgi:hypothetical protein
MNPVLQALLERVTDGLVWANADGKITYANQKAQLYAGLKVGDSLPDSPMARAVAVIASGKLQRELQLEFEPVSGSKQLLLAQVGPGMVSGEAWIYIKPPPAYGEALALHNLMTVIHSDLATPLKRFSSAMKSAFESENIQAFKETLVKTAEVTDTVVRLTDLASLWESEDLLAADRLELWPLLQECWLQQEPQAVSRKITVRLINRIDEDNMPVIYASHFWMNKVINESLAAALKAVPTSGTLDIELRQMGPRVLVVFRNSGMWPSRENDATMLADPNSEEAQAAAAAAAVAAAGKKPDPAKAPPPVNAKDLIGFHLCQRIMSLHGGQLREEEEDGMRNFLIDLPTGAPYRAEDAAMDAAQAQRYAADLATLMARRRQKSA